METESVMPKARMKLSQPDGPLCGAYAPATLPGVSPGLPPALDGEGVGVKACALATATLVSFPNLNFITKSEEAGKSFLTLTVIFFWMDPLAGTSSGVQTSEPVAEL